MGELWELWYWRYLFDEAIDWRPGTPWFVSHPGVWWCDWEWVG